MNSTHLTLHSIYEERTKWSVTQRNNKHIKEMAQTATSMTHESLTGNFSCIHFISQKQICLSKPATQLMGSNPHLIKRYKYIDEIISLPPADEPQNDQRKLEFVTNFLHH